MKTLILTLSVILFALNGIKGQINDVGVIAIVAPNSGFNLTATESITVAILNFGTDTLVNIPVSFRINGGIPITENPIATFSNQYDTLYYTFTATGDFSTSGTYIIDSWTSLGTDVDNSNDSITKTVLNYYQICLVTVVFATQKNMIVWEKTAFPGASHNIYKETTTAGVYDSIGNVVFDSLSIFIDNASNPVVTSAAYKIAIIDSNGSVSNSSFFPHRTIHMIVSEAIPFGVGLDWSPYEGFTVPTYRILRGTSRAVTIIDSVAGTTTQYTDTAQITQTADSLFYQIEVVHPTGGCTPTLKVSTYNSTKSNMSKRTLPVGIKQSNITNQKIIDIYPNPNTGTFNLSLGNKDYKIAFIKIYTGTGELINEVSIKAIKNNSYEIDLSDHSVGAYFVEVQLDNEIITNKIMITK